MEARIRAVWKGLDLAFSDSFAGSGENVRQDTLRKRLALMEGAVRTIQLGEGIDFSLWETLGKDHPSPEIYVFDFPSGLKASAYLLLGGYYRQAIALQRDWFEMKLLSIYFGRVDTRRQAYLEWKNGALAPIGTGLIRKSFSLAEFRKADLHLGLKADLRLVYAELSRYTHGTGLEKYHLQHQTDNVPRYNSKGVDVWSDLLDRVSRLAFLSLAIAYGSRTWLHLNKKEQLLLQRKIGSLAQFPR